MPGGTRVGARGAVVATGIRAIAARREGALLAATIVAWAKILARFRAVAAGTIIPVEPRRTRGIAAIIPARRRAFAFAGVGFARACIGFLAIRFGAVGFGGIGPLLATAFSGEIALGEFLVGPAGRTGAALAAGGPITPAARGSVVFIVIAGHEWSRFGYR